MSMEFLGCEFTADAVLNQVRFGCLPNDREPAGGQTA